MNYKKLLLFTSALFVLISCTPEIEDDYVRIDFADNTEFCMYDSDSTDAVLVKVRYFAHPTRNGVDLGDTVYTENTLFFRPDAGSYWVHRHTFAPDSNIFAAKRSINDIYFVQNDTLYIRLDIKTGTALVLDSLDYISPIVVSDPDSASADYITGLNSYKKYRSFKDGIINIYR
jgi:hypothetical protein